MRISDWSSDVCSSDLASAAWKPSPGPVRHAPQRGGKVESKRLFPDAVTMPDQSSEKPAPNQPGAQQPEDFKQAALDYHRLAPAGKIKVTATKPMVTQRELALAYSPGVAYACEEIAANPAAAHDYTARGNLRSEEHTSRLNSSH